MGKGTLLIGATMAPVLAAAVNRARRQEVGPIEERLFRAANELPDELHPPLWLVMQAGSLGGVFVTAAALCRRRDMDRARTVMVAGSAVWGGVKLVKPLVGRGRPRVYLDEVRVRGHEQSGLGFPSGHAAVTSTLALVGTPAGTVARLAAWAVTAVTGGARMYVGAHLPLDVVGGLAIGTIVGSMVNVLRRRLAPLTFILITS